MKRTYKDYNWEPVIVFESGGKNYYNRFLKTPTWPGGASGVTIGIGVDLGYIGIREFDLHFSKYFTKTNVNRLKTTIGIKGVNARPLIQQVKNIELSWENASEAFKDWTLPKFWNLTNTLWKGTDKLKEPAQVALVSIVFNRGASTVGPSRVEMRNIRELVLKKDYVGIANEIRSMKRLWVGKNLDGLLKRRDAEANIVESCA
jgi:GH24 family phage-related lysozyme (muramidase)